MAVKAKKAKPTARAAAPTPRRRRAKLDHATLDAIEEAADRASKRAARAAMRDVLLLLGIDAKTPEGLMVAQKNAAFVTRVREASESRPAKFGLAIFSALMSVVGGLIVLLIKHFIWPATS